MLKRFREAADECHTVTRDDAQRQSSRGETEVIRRISRLSTTRNARVRLGIGDDCAILGNTPGSEIVVSTDLCLEGRHFRRDWHTPESVGHRCLARGLSDIAAMGARPVAAFLSSGLPRGFELHWFDRFMRGFNALAALHGVELAGGDTAEMAGDLVVADIVLLGSVARGRALRRGGARIGDGLYVTGRLGGAALELERLAAGARAPRRAGEPGEHPQTFPEPRVNVGQALVRRGIATACMDLSDGLSSDLPRMCEASEVSAEVDEGVLPLWGEATLAQALDGGEDYELLFTAAARSHVPEKILGVPITRIGVMTEARQRTPRVLMVGGDGWKRPLTAGGWEHFRGEAE